MSSARDAELIAGREVNNDIHTRRSTPSVSQHEVTIHMDDEEALPAASVPFPRESDGDLQTTPPLGSNPSSEPTITYATSLQLAPNTADITEHQSSQGGRAKGSLSQSASGRSISRKPTNGGNGGAAFGVTQAHSLHQPSAYHTFSTYPLPKTTPVHAEAQDGDAAVVRDADPMTDETSSKDSYRSLRYAKRLTEGMGLLDADKISKEVEALATTATSEVSSEESVHDEKLHRRYCPCNRYRIIVGIVIAMFAVAAILLGVLLYRNLHDSELRRWRSDLGLLCHERAQVLQSIVAQAVQSMQQVAGFGQLSTRLLNVGSPAVPVGQGSFSINTDWVGAKLIPSYAHAEQLAYANKTVLQASLKQTDFVNFFAYSASPRFLQQIVWMPLIRNESRAEWESKTGIQIKYAPPPPNNTHFIPRTWDQPYYFPWQYIILQAGEAPDFIGLDMQWIENITQDMLSSINSGKVWVSNRTDPTNNDAYGNPQYGIYLNLPVYQHQAPASDLADSAKLLQGIEISAYHNATARFDDLIGVTFASIRMYSVMQTMLSTVESYPMELSLWDLDPVSPDFSFISNVNPLNDTNINEAQLETFSFSNHRFALKCTPQQSWVDDAYTRTPFFIVLGAVAILVVSIVLFVALLFFWRMQRALHRSRELQEAGRQKSEALATLQKAQQVSDSANQSKSEFLGFLCHELRNPLHAIGSMMEFLQSSDTLLHRAEVEDLECLDTIDSQVKLMNVLVNDALDLQKIEAGKMTFELIGFNMAKLLRSTAAGLKNRALSQGIALRIDIDPNIARWAYGDPTRIKQVVTNLLSNAIKFTNVGEVVVSARSFPASEWQGPLPEVSGIRTISVSNQEELSDRRSNSGSGDGTGKNKTPKAGGVSLNNAAAKRGPSATPPPASVPVAATDAAATVSQWPDANTPSPIPPAVAVAAAVAAADPSAVPAPVSNVPSRFATLMRLYVGFQIEIRDTGCGIGEANLPLLFQPFSQATLSVARKFGGTGLGLSIVKQIIELMGGTISVTSALYVGTTFVVRFLLPVERARKLENTGTSSGGTGDTSSGGNTTGTSLSRGGDSGNKPQTVKGSEVIASPPANVETEPSSRGKGQTPFVRLRSLRKPARVASEQKESGAAATASDAVESSNATPSEIMRVPSSQRQDSDRLSMTERAEAMDREPMGSISGIELFADRELREAAIFQQQRIQASSNESAAIPILECSSGSPKTRPTAAVVPVMPTPMFLEPSHEPKSMIDSNPVSTSLNESGTLTSTSSTASSASLAEMIPDVISPTIASKTVIESAATSSTPSSPNKIPKKRTIKGAAAQPVNTSTSLSVLVIDDSITNIKVMCRMLSPENCVCSTALDGQQALDIIRQRLRGEAPFKPEDSKQFDIIFSDVLMPVMDGLEFCRQLRIDEQQESLPSVPVVALTANAFVQDREDCFAAGMTHFLSKPFGRAQIQRILKQILQHREKSQQSTTQSQEQPQQSQPVSVQQVSLGQTPQSTQRSLEPALSKM